MPVQALIIKDNKATFIGPDNQLYKFPGSHKVSFQLSQSVDIHDRRHIHEALLEWIAGFETKQPLNTVRGYADDFLQAVSRNELKLSGAFPADRQLEVLHEFVTRDHIRKVSIYDPAAEYDFGFEPTEWEKVHDFSDLQREIEELNERPFDPTIFPDASPQRLKHLKDDVTFASDMFEDLILSDRVVKLLEENAEIIFKAEVLRGWPRIVYTFAGFGSEDQSPKVHQLSFGGRLGNILLVEESQQVEGLELYDTWTLAKWHQQLTPISLTEITKK